MTLGSKIYNNISLRLGATDQQITVRGCIDGLGPIADFPVHKAGLTSVADPRPTGPPHRNVTRFSQLKKARESRSPANIQTAPRE